MAVAVLLSLSHASVQAAPVPGAEAGSAVSGDAMAGGTMPQPGLLQYNGDWAVGCDNLLRCEAVALQPDGVATDDEPMLLQIARTGGAIGEVALRVSGLSQIPAEMMLVVDGREAGRLVAQAGDEASIHGPEALRLVQALSSAVTIELRSGSKKARKDPALATISGVGLADSLRFMDTRQKRTGTQSALVARGDAPDDSVPEPPAVPTVHQMPSPDADSVAGLDTGELAVARRLAKCDAMGNADGVAELFPLDGNAALLLLPCEAGAYNVSAVPLIARGPAGARVLTVARFDLSPGATGEPGKPPLVVNALWDARRGVLSSLAKGRGIGDCGASEDYVWDGAMFRLIESRAMQVCRGAWEWIRLWEARPEKSLSQPETVAHSATTEPLRP